MLSDPILLVSSGEVDIQTATLVASKRLALVPSGTPGTTKRIDVDGTSTLTLTISRSESKENSPYVTNRTVQRLDLQKIDALGKKVVLSCYVVVAAPLSDLFTQEVVEAHVRDACLFAAYGGATEDSLMQMSPLNPHLGRILEGEG
jgi:hypothetical protein